MSAHTCPASVYPPGAWSSHTCGRNAAFEHEGKHYCKTHHPPTIRAKRDAKNAAWDKEWTERRAALEKASAAKAELERRAGLYDDLLAAVKHAQEWTDPESVLGIRLAEVIAKAEGK